MDPFEEFEFKPLTDGLGFHKKKQTPPASNKGEFDDFQPIIKDNNMSMLEDSPIDPLRSPLPRKNDVIPETPDFIAKYENPDSTSTAAAVDEILKTLQKNRRLDQEAADKAKAVQKAEVKPIYKAAGWSLSAAFLDAMLIVAGSLLCMIIMLVITKVDIVRNLQNPDQQNFIYISTIALLAMVTFVYLTVNRIFAQCTPGDWAYDQIIGKPEDVKSGLFSLKITARSLLIVGTGFILLPLLSLIFQKDIAGKITGTTLHKRA